MAAYEQPGRTTVTDQNGKQTVTITYVGDSEVASATGFNGTLKSRTVTTDVAGTVRTTFVYEIGSDTDRPPDSSGATVEVVAAVRTVPIEAHPVFGGEGQGGFVPNEAKKIIRDAVNTTGKKFSDLEDQLRETGANISRARSLYGYLAAGITSYYVPGLVVRKIYQAASPPSTTAQVGKIASPGVSVPGAPNKASFLLINVSARGTQGSYTVTEEYEASGEGGWDTFLYR